MPLKRRSSIGLLNRLSAESRSLNRPAGQLVSGKSELPMNPSGKAIANLAIGAERCLYHQHQCQRQPPGSACLLASRLQVAGLFSIGMRLGLAGPASFTRHAEWRA